MADDGVADQVVASPTYMADIRFFFRPVDVDHMGAKGIDLGTYDDVKKNALAVFAHTAPPNADMPPDAPGKWSAERSQRSRTGSSTGSRWALRRRPPPAPRRPMARPARLRIASVRT